MLLIFRRQKDQKIRCVKGHEPVQNFLKATHHRKQAAKEEVQAMSESEGVSSSEEEAESMQKLEEIRKDFDENRGVFAAVAEGSTTTPLMVVGFCLG